MSESAVTALVGAQVPDAADGELRAAPPRQDAVDLRVALMVAVGSLILYLGIAPMVVGQWRDFAAWWSLAAVTLMVPAVVVPLLGEAAPPRALRTLLWGFPIATLALLATWTVARTGPDARTASSNASISARCSRCIRAAFRCAQ